MEDRLLKVKEVFDDVKEMRSEISNLFESLDGRITKLKDIYKDFIKNTNAIKSPDVKPFIFSLDSFYFQTSLLEKEFNYLKDYKTIIINRMYGEYYKLFKLINIYVDRSHIDNKLNEILKHKKYPKYDDLDDSKEYDFNLITQVNEDIMNIVNYLINILKDKELALKQYTTNQNYGLNVDNFVSTYNYEVVVLREQINLYEKYLEFFYKVHQKLLNCLIVKISVLEAQITTDIKFEGGLLSTKKDNSVIFEEMNIGNLNKSTARQLRQSITGKTSAINSPYSSSNDSSNYYSEQNDNDNDNDNDINDNDINDNDNDNVEKITIINTSITLHETIMTDQPLDIPIKANNFFQQDILLTSDEIPDHLLDNNYSEQYDRIPKIEELNNINNTKSSETTELVNKDEVSDEVSDEVLVEDDTEEESDEVLVEDDTEEEYLNNNLENDGSVILTSKQKKNLKKNIKKKEKKERERNENELNIGQIVPSNDLL